MFSGNLRGPWEWMKAIPTRCEIRGKEEPAEMAGTAHEAPKSLIFIGFAHTIHSSYPMETPP